MKLTCTAILLIICSLSPILSFAQEDDQAISRLKSKILSIEQDIQMKKDSLSKLKEMLQIAENHLYISKSKENNGKLSVPAIIKTDGKIRKSSDPFSEVMVTIKKGQTVQLTGYENGYWIIGTGTVHGFLSDLYVVETEEIKAIRNELDKRYKIRQDSIVAQNRKVRDLSEKEREAIKQKFQDEFRNDVINQYGATIAERLFNHHYWIGMTDQMARISLGNPQNTNKSVGAWGVHEQWVYKNVNLYFENGKLTSYQHSN